jgi:hypothetical protein
MLGRFSAPFFTLSLAAVIAPGLAWAAPACERSLRADVVALDQPFFWNRLGAVQPQGMIFALKRDIVPIDASLGLTKGNVRLREDKRPRPLVLRMNVGDCLTVQFENLLADTPRDQEQPATRAASIHVEGLALVNTSGGILNDGSHVGQNQSGLVAPGYSRSYTLYAEREGGHVLFSAAATTGGEGDGGALNAGLFGAVNVEPRGAQWFRSQVTAADLSLASKGTTAGGQPIIDYGAVYPPGHARADTPILNMLMGDEIVHSDLTALITGPNAGRFPAGTYRSVPATPDRSQPFREFTVIYHDEIGAVQAFELFEDAVFGHTLHSVRDGFAINYGSAGVGAAVIANRLGVGPMHDCVECKYEEFFLSSWTISDPATVVDVPANATDSAGNLIVGPKATKALYPDDPSNVYHSYLRDHVKFRILHGGSKEHHIHHQHAHQWLHTPDSDNSTYLDSQAIGPGTAFNLEIAHHGGGNRNGAVGDSIFHCHFYPHFAQGMWSLWRVHDVFESGTVVDASGRPVYGARALPDGEIAAGTPIPALVPLPTLAMAPTPGATVSIVNGQVQVTGDGNPGFPFFVPALAGHRAPHPPLDTVDDGGLPRHVVKGGTALFPSDDTGVPNSPQFSPNRLSLDKQVVSMNAEPVPESGTAVELAAMAFHAQRRHGSYKPDGTTADFVVNGLPPQAGAPYADPCVDDSGNAAGVARIYKAAAIQTNITLNKAGWHFPQSRLTALWGDVAATLDGSRPPQPLFFRANTGDCIDYYHSNLVPGVYLQDAFQVRTPTDVIGQHIHLVKFDVTGSDGSGNGWNYEDGTFAADEVRERIRAIRASNACLEPDPRDGDFLCPIAREHPYFGAGPAGIWLGAQTTVQRWYADNVLNNLGQDRTLRTVFTHDHFGPSTHQQVGLYAGLVIEPVGSSWRDSETGTAFGGRFDGGPTSWRADIITSPASNSYREFLLAFSDFQLAYTADGNPVNPPARKEVGLPKLVQAAPECPGGVSLPCPEAISSEDPGTMSLNYRNEPVALRIRDPLTNTQAAGEAGDLSHVFRSNVARADAAFNTQPTFSPPLTGGLLPGDPYTPLLRAYENDKVQIRVLVGGQEEGHNFGVHGGIRWLFEPNDPNSGFRNSQMMGLSEHFEFVLPPLPVKGSTPFADFLYKPSQAVDGLWNGLWGILREYNGGAGLQSDLQTLPNNPNGKAPPMTNPGSFAGTCPKTSPSRNLNVTAVAAQQALPGGTLVYNGRAGNGGALHDPTAILYVRSEDLKDGKLKLGVPIEPLILRANAGDCVNVTLTNQLPASLPEADGFSTLPMIVEGFNANEVRTSNHVGLHAQLLSMQTDDGVNVGMNPLETAAPGGTIKYKWYAGKVEVLPTGMRIAVPVEFGAINFISSDPIKHSSKGAIGALIIEPRYATWDEDADSRASATVSLNNANGTPQTNPDGTPKIFREFVVLLQNDLNLRNDQGAVPNLADSEDSEDSGQKAVNYRTEPMWKRLGFAPDTDLETTRTLDFSGALSNDQVVGDPITPVFTAKAGTPVRFRLLHPGGHQRNNVFMLHGHMWQEEPYVTSSSVIGSNPLSEWKGAQHGIGPGEHFDFVLQNGAGGAFGVPGDYLWRTFQSFQFDGGMWGILRVTP